MEKAKAIPFGSAEDRRSGQRTNERGEQGGKKMEELRPIDVPCTKCRKAIGQPCRNYKGKNKQPCPVRVALSKGIDFDAITQADDQQSGLAFPDDQAEHQGAEPVADAQQQLYPGLYPERIATQQELFPGFDAREPRRVIGRRGGPDLPGQLTFE